MSHTMYEGCALANMVHLYQFRELKVVICLWRSPIPWVPGGRACVYVFFWSLNEYNLSDGDYMHLVGDLCFFRYTASKYKGVS